MPIAAATKERILRPDGHIPCGSAASAADTPAYCRRLGSRYVKRGGDGDKERPGIKHCHVRTLRLRRRVFQRTSSPRPVILGLFSGPVGGGLSCTVQGWRPLEAPQCHRLSAEKSVGHSVMALSEVVMPYLDNTETSPGRPLLLSQPDADGARHSGRHRYCRRDWRATSRTLLQNNIAFMDACTEKGSISTLICKASPGAGPF